MNLKRMAASVVATVIAVAGLSVATAGPAQASIGRWMAFGNVSPFVTLPAHWACGTTYQFENSVYAQTCAIRPDTRSPYVQVAVIVRNNRSTTFQAEAAVSMSDIDGFFDRWYCTPSGVARQSWSVCFGDTLNHPGYANGRGGINGFDLDISPHV